MTWLYALAGIFGIAFIYSYSKRIGAILLILAVLGIWLTMQKKGII